MLSWLWFERPAFGGNIMNETYCYILNKDGLEYRYTENGIEKFENSYYSKFSDFRYVPYPHEREHIQED